MEQNPYESPKSFERVEKRPEGSSEKPTYRYVLAPFFGFLACVGVLGLEWTISGLRLGIASDSGWLGMCALLVLPLLFGAVIAYRTFRNPKSKWNAIVAITLAVSPLVVDSIWSHFF
jgi:ABC-type antimicrobial peptide transport system permease subunit